jgi:hypothetical protein
MRKRFSGSYRALRRPRHPGSDAGNHTHPRPLTERGVRQMLQHPPVAVHIAALDLVRSSSPPQSRLETAATTGRRPPSSTDPVSRPTPPDHIDGQVGRTESPTGSDSSRRGASSPPSAAIRHGMCSSMSNRRTRLPCQLLVGRQQTGGNVREDRRPGFGVAGSPAVPGGHELLHRPVGVDPRSAGNPDQRGSATPPSGDPRRPRSARHSGPHLHRSSPGTPVPDHFQPSGLLGRLP